MQPTRMGEALASVSAFTAPLWDWRELLGDELPCWMDVLEPLDEHGDLIRCPRTSRSGCLRQRWDLGGRVLMRCQHYPERCDEQEVQKADLLEHRVDLIALGGRLQHALGLMGRVQSVDGLPFLVNIGYRSSVDGAETTYLLTRADSRSVDRTLARASDWARRPTRLILPVGRLLDQRLLAVLPSLVTPVLLEALVGVPRMSDGAGQLTLMGSPQPVTKPPSMQAQADAAAPSVCRVISAGHERNPQPVSQQVLQAMLDEAPSFVFDLRTSRPTVQFEGRDPAPLGLRGHYGSILEALVTRGAPTSAELVEDHMSNLELDPNTIRDRLGRMRSKLNNAVAHLGIQVVERQQTENGLRFKWLSPSTPYLVLLPPGESEFV